MITERFTTIFLLDDLNTPRYVLMLNRAADRKFAPNLYTGIGGKVESGETPLACAKRELTEEAGLSNIQLVEFANVVVNDTRKLHQFFGKYKMGLPPGCTEGYLEWVAFRNLWTKDIIPATKLFLEEWQVRGWSTRARFTMRVQRQSLESLHSRVLSFHTFEGLDKDNDST